MSKENLSLEAFSTKEIALSQKPIAEVLKEHEGMVISYNKGSVKKNLNALVKKYQKEIDDLIKLEVLTVKQENRLIELRKLYKDSRIALGKITTHNVSVLAAASKHSKEIKDELILIVSPVEDKITERLDAEETRRANARNAKIEEDNKRKEKIEDYIADRKDDLQKIITKTKTFESIEDNKKEYLQLVADTREFIKDKFSLDEFEVSFDTMLTTQAEAFQGVIDSLTNAYNAEKTNRALEVQKLTNERMNELFDFNFRYKGEVELGELDEEEYAEVMIPERTKFRISELEKLGFTESAAYKGHYAYIPDGVTLILTSVREDEYQLAGNEDWNEIFEKAKLEIEKYNAPTPAVEKLVSKYKAEDAGEENSTEAEVSEVKQAVAEDEGTVERMNFAAPAVKTATITLQGETKQAPEPIEFDSLKQQTPVQKLIDLLISRGFTEGFIEETMKPVLREERGAIIDAYNDGQTDTINILIGEIEKEAPELMEGMREQFEGNVNRMDSVDYFNNKYPE